MKRRLLLFLLLTMVCAPLFGMKKEAQEVVLVSKDKKKFKIGIEKAKLSSVLRDMIEEMEDEEEKIVIPVPAIESTYLRIMRTLMTLEYKLKVEKKSDLVIRKKLYEKLSTEKKRIGKKFSMRAMFRASTYLGCPNIERVIVRLVITLYPKALISKKPKNVLQLSEAEVRDVFVPLVKKERVYSLRTYDSKKFDKLFNRIKKEEFARNYLLKFILKEAGKKVESLKKEVLLKKINKLGKDTFSALAIEIKYKELKGEFLGEKTYFPVVKNYQITTAYSMEYHKCLSWESPDVEIDISEDVLNKVLYLFSCSKLYLDKKKANKFISIVGWELSRFPEALTACKSYYDNITGISLNYNDIVKIPVGIKNCKRLEVLSLTGNNIEILPTELGELTKLKILALNENKIKKIFPEIGKLVNLEDLDLRKNEIKQLPSTIGNLVKLKYLALQNNPIKKLPKEMGKLKNLERLGLRNTKIKKLPGSVEALRKQKLKYVSGLKDSLY